MRRRLARLIFVGAAVGGSLAASAQVISNGTTANFGAVEIGTSVTQTVTFNVTTSGNVVGNVETQGSVGFDFLRGPGGTCFGTPAKGSCTVNVIFKPQGAGARSGIVNLTNSSNVTVATALLTGNGIGPVIAFPSNTATTTIVSGLNQTQHLVVDAGGSYFVTMNDCNVHVYGRRGTYTTGGGTAAGARTTNCFNGSPISVDAAGNILVRDLLTNNLIQIEAVNGATTSSSATRVVYPNFPGTYIALDNQGDLFYIAGLCQANSQSETLHELVAVNGAISSGSTDIAWNTPINCVESQIAVDYAGNVYYGEYLQNTIVEVQAVNGALSANSPALVLTGGLNNPQGIAVDGAGNVFFRDFVSGGAQADIKEIQASGGAISQNSPIVTLTNSQSNPGDLQVDGLGNIYLTTAGGSTINEYVLATPNAITFPATAVGNASGTKTVTLYNNGTDALSFPNPSTGSNPTVTADYTLSNSSTCPILTPGVSSPGTLAPGQSCSTVLAFTPVKPNDTTGTLTFTDTTGNSNSANQVAFLSGFSTSATGRTAQTITFPQPTTPAGTGSSITLAATANSGLPILYKVLSGPAVLNGSLLSYTGIGTVVVEADQYGDSTYAAAPSVRVNITTTVQQTGVGTSSAPVSALVTFTTAGTLGNIYVLTTGQPSLDYQATGNTSCVVGQAYTVNATCTVEYTFLPLAPGLRRGAVQLVANDGVTILGNAFLTGIGQGAAVSFPSNTDFSLVATGATKPEGVALDAAGNLYVADFGASQIRELLAVNGSIPANPTVRILGSGFKTPSALAIDGLGDVFVSDNGNNVVKEIIALGGTIPANPVIRSLSGLGSPLGLAVDGTGNVFFSSSTTLTQINAVNGVIPASVTTRIIGSDSNAGYSGIYVDGANNLFAASGGAGSVLEFAGSNGVTGTYGSTVATGLNGPRAVTVDAAGDLFVADYLNHALKEVVAVNGHVTTSSPIRTIGAVANNDYGIAVDAAGNLFAADAVANGVRLFATGTAPAQSFASTPVGTTSSDSPKTVVVQNIGNLALTFPVPSTGTNPAASTYFSVNNATTCPQVTASSNAPGSLAAGATCLEMLSFSPTVSGNLSGSVLLTDNAFNGATQSIPLTGNATPVLRLTSISPSAGPSSGGNTILVNGSCLGSTAGVIFGPNLASGYTILSDTQLSVVVPPGNVGTSLDVVVEATCNGVFKATPKSAADLYLYQAATILTLAIPNAHTGDPAFQLAATSNSNGPVVYTVVSGPATVNGSTVTLNPGAAGRVVIEADQAASGYYAAASVQTAFTVESGNGSVWILNGDGSVSEYDLNGNLLSPPAGSMGAAVGTVPSPQGAAFDSLGDLWIVGVNGVNYYTPNGTPGSTTPLTTGGISDPKSVIVDGVGHVWILNGNGSVSLIKGTGSPITPATGYTGGGINSPSALTIDTGGNLWITNGNNSLTEILGGAGPIAPLAIGVQNGTTGARP